MSLVTTVVIVGYVHPTEMERINEFAWDEGKRSPEFPLKAPDLPSSGSKCPTGVWIGGFNYFDWSKFCDHLDTIKFADAEGLVVSMSCETGWADTWRPTYQTSDFGSIIWPDDPRYEKEGQR